MEVGVMKDNFCVGRSHVDDNVGEKCHRPVSKEHFNSFITGGPTVWRRFQKTFLASLSSIAHVVVVGKDYITLITMMVAV